MKLFLALLFAVSALASCAGSGSGPPVKIVTPEVKAQVIGDVEKDLLAAGGALLMTNGNWGAAAVALSQQELKNIPDLSAKLQAAAAANAAASSGLSAGAGSAGLQPIVGPLPAPPGGK